MAALLTQVQGPCPDSERGLLPSLMISYWETVAAVSDAVVWNRGRYQRWTSRFWSPPPRQYIFAISESLRRVDEHRVPPLLAVYEYLALESLYEQRTPRETGPYEITFFTIRDVCFAQPDPKSKRVPVSRPTA